MFQEELSLTTKRPMETPSERVIEPSLDSSSSSNPASFEVPVFETSDCCRFTLAVFVSVDVGADRSGCSAWAGKKSLEPGHDISCAGVQSVTKLSKPIGCIAKMHSTVFSLFSLLVNAEDAFPQTKRKR